MDAAPEHNPVWAVLLGRFVAARGIDVAPLLEACGLHGVGPGEADARVPFTQIARFFELCAERAGDDLVGFHFGTETDVRDAGLITFLGAYSERMRDGIVTVARYSKVFGDAVAFDVSRLEPEGRLAYEYRVPIAVERRQYVEWFAAGCVHGYRDVMKAPISCTAVRFRHLRRDGMREMERFFGCAVEFGAEENALYFRAADLDRQIPIADNKLLAFLVGLAESALARNPSNAPRIQLEVERAAARRLSSGRVTQADIAADLGLSQRTLARRLQDEGLTLRKVLNDLRAALATRYLVHSTLSQAQIAFNLGFSDQSAFSSAYRQWTGRTPGEVRRDSLARSVPHEQRR